MDSWSDRQISFMKAGGNTQAKLWLERYNVKEVDLKNKYSSPALEAYREKLKAAVENRAYTDPTPEELAKKASPYGSRNGSPSLGGYSASSSPHTSHTSQSSRNGLSSSASGGHLSKSGGGFQTQGGFQTSSGGYGGSEDGRFGRSSGGFYDTASGQREGGSYGGSPGGSDLQTRFAGRNAIGSHDFGGSGSSRGSPQPDNGDDDLMNAFYDGWSRFSTGVKQAASTAAEKVSSGALTDEVSQLATKVTESQTWNYVTSFFSGGPEEGGQGPVPPRGPPSRDERFYSSDRPPPASHDPMDRSVGGPRDDRFANDERQGYGSRHDEPVPRSHSAQPNGRSYSSQQGSSSGSWGQERMDSSKRTGERQGLRVDSRDPREPSHRRPHSANPNGWGGNDDSWDDWDSHSKPAAHNPAVASFEDDVVVDDYKPSSGSPHVVAPKPSRAPLSSSDDIYDFQVSAPSSAASKSPASQPASGWDDWDDWSRGKK